MAGPTHRILLLADRIANPLQAGTVLAFADRLARRGLRARILCASWGVPDRGGVEVEECAALGQRWRLAWALRGVCRPDAADRPSLIHALQARLAPAALEMAERWRVPYLQGVEEFLPEGTRLRLSRRWCRGLVATSRELKDELVRDFGVPDDWVRVVHRGLEASEPAPASRVVGEGPRVAVVGTAGPLAPGSGFATFLNAARRVLDAGVDAEFVIVGEGDEEGDLRRRAERLRIAERLTIAGVAAIGLSFWDVLDVYCQPATAPTVGRGLARAMAHALPVVASDIEGLRSLVAPGETGLRVPPGETNALARAILDLLADRPRALRLGLEARASVLREYDLDREVDALEEAYRAIIEAEAATVVR